MMINMNVLSYCAMPYRLKSPKLAHNIHAVLCCCLFCWDVWWTHEYFATMLNLNWLWLISIALLFKPDHCHENIWFVLNIVVCTCCYADCPCCKLVMNLCCCSNHPVQNFMLMFVCCWMMLPVPIPCGLYAGWMLCWCWKYWMPWTLLQIWNMLYAVVWLHCEHYQLPCQLCIVGISIAMTFNVDDWWPCYAKPLLMYVWAKSILMLVITCAAMLKNMYCYAEFQLIMNWFPCPVAVTMINIACWMLCCYVLLVVFVWFGDGHDNECCSWLSLLQCLKL